MRGGDNINDKEFDIIAKYINISKNSETELKTGLECAKKHLNLTPTQAQIGESKAEIYHSVTAMLEKMMSELEEASIKTKKNSAIVLRGNESRYITPED